jgi:hypothetical protein
LRANSPIGQKALMGGINSSFSHLYLDMVEFITAYLFA